MPRARCRMESKALLAIALWLCVETRATTVGKEPTQYKKAERSGAGSEMGM